MKKDRGTALRLHRETLRLLDAAFLPTALGRNIPDGSQAQPCRSPQTLFVTCSGHAGCNQTNTEQADSACHCPSDRLP